MKLSKHKLALAILAASAVGMASLGTAGISNTKHNLGTSGTGDTKTTAGGALSTGEICVFCHTPHGSDTGAPVPLWNKKLPAASSFTTYDQLGTSSLDGSVASVGSVSLACLSCHDGSQAMDNMINAPGSGGYAADGGGVDGRDMTWTTASSAAGSTGKMVGGPIPMLGTDLKNDHPVGIQYCGGGTVATSPGAIVADTDCKDKDFKDFVQGSANTSTVWWVDTETSGNGTREKTDMQLYTRSVTGIEGGAATPFVECASCHDPHTEVATFLRVVNTGSAVCLACHDK
ncbi:MAG: cytochrome c3 family protein [Motiliproteus sp.]